MDGLDIATMALTAALAGIVAASVMGYRLELAPALAHRRVLKDLRTDVQRLADEHAAQPAPRHRHNAHCPACGRFARVTSTGPRGVRTRCAAHGIRLRAVKRIGRHEVTLVGLTLVPDQRLRIAPPLVEHADAMRPTVRLADWLDGDLGNVTPLRRALAVAA